MPHPHDRHIQRAWQVCREAIVICQRDENENQKALAFCARAHKVAAPHMQRWVEILQGGYKTHVDQLLRIENFFSMSPQEQAWWDQLVQSAPFAPVMGWRLRERERAQKAQLQENVDMRPMTLEQFDHICRAAAVVTDVKRVHVFGANAIIPWLVQSKLPVPSPGFPPSRELDVTTGDEHLDDLIDGSIGEFSAFDETFSVYAHGISLSSFQAPQNWQERTMLKIEPQSGVEIVAPHPHDLLISKLAAGRPKDFEFATAAARLFPISDEVLEQLVEEFGQSHPEAVELLRRNVEVWRAKRASA